MLSYFGSSIVIHQLGTESLKLPIKKKSLKLNLTRNCPQFLKNLGTQ